MAMVTAASPSKTTISQTSSFENNNNNRHRDSSSLSSYLNGSEETYVLTLGKSSSNFNSLTSKPNANLFLGKKEVEDGEIGVFDAKKYFNEESPRLKKSDTYNQLVDIDIAPVKTKAQPRTPSVRSQSSWNSQRALLHRSTRNPLRRKPKKGQGKSFFTALGCYCSCNDKNSVDINEHVGENNSTKSGTCGVIQGKKVAKEPVKNGLDSVDLARIDDLGLGLNRSEECFSFPVLKSNTRNLAVKVKLQQQQEEEDGKPRDSLEVFGSPILEKGLKTPTLERKLTMLNWDSAISTPRVEETGIHSNPNGTYNDTESDASSDLFEIESLTNSGNHFLTRQESDGMSCYAPSEASIEWSVVTASFADFSAMSDSEELSSISKATSLKKIAPTPNSSQNKEMQKRRTSLLACKSHKAVRVVGDAYRTSEKATNEPSRFRGEPNLTQFDSKKWTLSDNIDM